MVDYFLVLKQLYSFKTLNVQAFSEFRDPSVYGVIYDIPILLREKAFLEKTSLFFEVFILKFGDVNKKMTLAKFFTNFANVRLGVKF
jgi:hypothetical protein